MATDRIWKLRLLGGWQLQRGDQPVTVALRQQRLIAALALYGRQPRTFLAGLLWPDRPEHQGFGNLRESVFVVNRDLPKLLVPTRHSLDLAERARIDVRDIRAQASGAEEQTGPDLPQSILDTVLEAELLPGWGEDWVISEQDRWQRWRLSVLERLARQFLLQGQIDLAVEAARAATTIEPLRESAQRLLLQCYLAEGNQAEALRAYQSFRIRLRQEFGVDPSPFTADLVSSLLTD
ncbi:AfsR/SARP family transcriptional regulator [Arthrobacter sp. VKM Ac-2550]|uniref:AfsR/SARP family transcriptional regulator n=1 Tax=Crystallibacter permensis TaxID=1938888 RepID=UPI002225C09C|nr:BTAD domain-containing putative transcriptional regulator [Arthrobacter sp. VKM Ac-2550]MCW2135447.1 DNA-binding transcriptional activator of the SARP family [Arthrobacter sp. VKM Ac-2550]